MSCKLDEIREIYTQKTEAKTAVNELRQEYILKRDCADHTIINEDGT
jgi:hypothetical protein